MTEFNSSPGFFARLVPLLAHRAVLITVSQRNDGRLQVNICPRQLKESENQALMAPLSVTGTAEELDAELLPQLSTFVAAHVGLNSNLAEIEKELAEADKAAREEAKKKQKVVGNGGKKQDPSPANSNDTETEIPSTPARTLNLFDEPQAGS